MKEILEGTWVKIKDKVYVDGYDLSNKYGIVTNNYSYIKVEIDEFEKEFKLLRREIETIFSEDELFSDFDWDDTTPTM